MADGSPITLDVLSEIEGVSNGLTFEHRWQARDLVMLDNFRFMHGRRAYDSSVTRDIVQIQTHRASFGYGSTTRRSRPGSGI
jgi:alpha-ketoglutarate-dependent taurine dioxygenase